MICVTFPANLITLIISGVPDLPTTLEQEDTTTVSPEVTTPRAEEEDWIIIQRRVDASLSFDKRWNEYVTGFGDVDENFWLGLEDIHRLTTEQRMSLQIDVVPFHLPVVSIPYPQFHVGDAASDYLLTVTSNTPGPYNLYNSFNYNSGNKFTTYDRNNVDRSNYDCAENYGAGWWFNRISPCSMLNLNGIYGGAAEIEHNNMRMTYLSDDMYEPIRTVTMKIRAIN